MRTHALTVAFFALTAVAMLYPQSMSPWDTIWFVGDPLDSVYFVGWTARQIFTDPLSLFDANILYPHPQAALFDTPRILAGLVASPVVWATDNPILGYNVALLLIYTFTGWCGFRLARALGIEPIGAWAAGALYAFHTFQISESPRANTVFHGFVALSLMELVRYYQTGERRHGWRVAGFMLLQGFADQYHLVYATLLLSLVTLVAMVARPRRTLAQLPGLAVPALTAAVLFLPVVIGYISMSRTYDYDREVSPGIDLVNYWATSPTSQGVDLRNYLSTSPTNVLYGDRSGSARLALRQGPHFTGFASLALAALALGAWLLGRGGSSPPPAGTTPAILRERFWVPAVAGFFLIFVVLSLGPEMLAFGRSFGPGPYRLLHDWVPGFGYLRLPERLSLIAMLFLGLLAGRGVSLVRMRFGLWAALALSALVPIEHLAPLPDVTRLPAGASVPKVYRWLSAQSARAVAEVPINGEGLTRFETLEEYFSLFHRKPIIHGYVTFEPLLSSMLRRAAEEFPSEYSLQAFARAGVDTVIVHTSRENVEPIRRALPAALREGRIEHLAQFPPEPAWAYGGGGQDVYRLLPPVPLAAAPFPTGERRRNLGWRYSSRTGSAEAIGDDDLSTVWEVQDLAQAETLHIGFRGQGVRVSGVVIPMMRSSFFPHAFDIEGRRPDGPWEVAARFDDAHRLQLIDRLLLSPGAADVGFDLGDREFVALRLVARGKSFMGWRIHELEVLVKPTGATSSELRP